MKYKKYKELILGMGAFAILSGSLYLGGVDKSVLSVEASDTSFDPSTDENYLNYLNYLEYLENLKLEEEAKQQEDKSNYKDVKIVTVQQGYPAVTKRIAVESFKNTPYEITLQNAKNTMVPISILADILGIKDEDIIYNQDDNTININYQAKQFVLKKESGMFTIKDLSKEGSIFTSSSAIQNNGKIEYKNGEIFIPAIAIKQMFDINLHWMGTVSTLTVSFEEGHAIESVIIDKLIEDYNNNNFNLNYTTSERTTEANSQLITEATTGHILSQATTEPTTQVATLQYFTQVTTEPTTEVTTQTTTKMQFETQDQININNLYNTNSNLPSNVDKVTLTLTASTASSYYERNAYIKNNYIYISGDKYITVTVLDTKYNTVNQLDDVKEKVYISTFDSNFNKISEKQVDFELGVFGGFYTNGINNFMVFGEDNLDEINSASVYEIVKYDMNFNKLNSLVIRGGESNTVVPFEYGSLSMSSNSNYSELVVHTTRLNYENTSGVNQQTQMTFVIDTDTMTLKNDIAEDQNNLVIHSFNQFASYDTYGHILVDHGVAHPRAVVLNKSTGTNTYQSVNLLEIGGTVDTNTYTGYTGVSVGGLEVSSTSYLVPINKVDFTKVTRYDSYVLETLEKDVVLLMVDRDLSKVQNITLHTYVGTGKTSGTPKIVSMPNDMYMVLWEEHEIASATVAKVATDVKYMIIDGSGNVRREVQSLAGIRLSEVQPVYNNGNIIWFVDNDLYRLKL